MDLERKHGIKKLYFFKKFTLVNTYEIRYNYLRLCIGTLFYKKDRGIGK